ncbi:MAG: alpha/beta hydrolase [Butyrivibrio sp.]|nr:alpha/beta hydrolase [Butyrivibrio sp.]
MIILIIILIIFIIFSYSLAAYAVRGKRSSLLETSTYEQKTYPRGAAYINKGTAYTIEGFEGYTLHAEHIKSPSGDGKHFVIITHGHTSTRYGAIKYVPIYINRGYDCIIYDLRGHGENLYQGKRKMPLRLGKKEICWFSRKESKDLLKVIEDTRNRFGSDVLIGLHGESLGAASTLAALAEKPDVAFAVEDCGFADIVNVQKVGLKFMHIPTFMVYPASVMCRLIYGYSFTSTRPVDAIKDNEVPLLVIHGEADDFILLDNAKRIFEAQKGFKRMEIFPGAGHAMSLISDPVRYEKIVNEFLDSIGF